MPVYVDDRNDYDLKSIDPCRHRRVHPVAGNKFPDGCCANLSAHHFVSMVTAVEQYRRLLLSRDARCW